MTFTDVFKRAQTGELQLLRGRIAEIELDGRVRVRLDQAGAAEVVCDVLRTGVGEAALLLPGIEVLLARSDGSETTGVILGAIGPIPARGQPTEPAPGIVELSTAAPAPGEPLRIAHREIVIEAGEELTLRCGEASIRITRDGKIVLRGDHILSRARGTQRIKGGSVAIN